MHDLIQDFTKKSVVYLESRREFLNSSRDEIVKSFEEILKKTPSINNISIDGRVKGIDSLKEKIVRKNYHFTYENNEVSFLNELPDLIGIRVTCFLNIEESGVYENILNKFSKYVEEKDFYLLQEQNEKQYPYIAFVKKTQPEVQKNGNPIYRIPLKYVLNNSEDPLNIELQIKSLTHMFWGELEHMLFYKNYSYTINSNFYSSMMGSINELLKNIDIQLLRLKEQLSPKNEINQIKEIKEITSKLMYEKVHPQVKKILHTEIDLREVYSIISEMIFLNTNSYEKAFELGNEYFRKISSLNLELESFNFQNEEIAHRNLSCDRSYYPLIEKIDTLAKKEDLFWNCFLTIYKTLKNISYIEAVEEISTTFIKSINNEISSDKTIPEIPSNVHEFLKEKIVKVIIDTFSKYKKIDFFIEDIHKEEISKRLITSIQHHQFMIEIAEEQAESSEKVVFQEIVYWILRLQLNYYLFSEVGIEDLKALKENLDMDSPWTGEGINYELLRQVIEGEVSISKNENELYDLLHYYPEEEGELS